MERIKSFDEFINGLFTNPIEYDRITLHNAIKGITSHIGTVIEIIVTIPSFILKQMAQNIQEYTKAKTLLKI